MLREIAANERSAKSACAVNLVGAALEGRGEAAKSGIEHRAHQQAERAAPEFIGDEEFDLAGVLAGGLEGPAVLHAAERPSRYSTRMCRFGRSSVTRLVKVSRISL